MAATSPSIITLDGATRAWDEVFAQDRAARHGLDDRAGYIVRRTFFGGRAHEDVAVFAADEYGFALERVQAVRGENPNGYGVIDHLYSNGDRLNG